MDDKQPTTTKYYVKNLIDPANTDDETFLKFGQTQNFPGGI